MFKKIFFIVLIVLVLVIAGFVIWKFVLQAGPELVKEETVIPQQSLPITETPTEIQEGLESTIVLSSSQAQPSVFIDEPVFDYWVNKKENKIYFLDENGKIKNQDGQFISDQSFIDLNYIKQSADANKLLIAFGKPQKPSFTIFDLQKKSFSPLPDIIAAAFHPKDVNSLIYLDQNKNLKKLNLSNQKSQTIIKINLVDVDLDWLSDDVVLIKDKPSAYSVVSAWTLDIRTKVFKELFSEERGLIINPILELDSLLVSDIAENGQANISLRSTTDNIGALGDMFLSVSLARMSGNTMVDKCAYHFSDLYCATFFQIHSPKNKVGLPDDYLTHEIYTVDGLMKLPEMQLIFEPNEKTYFDIQNISILGDFLYFKNRYDQRVYRVSI